MKNKKDLSQPLSQQERQVLKSSPQMTLSVIRELRDVLKIEADIFKANAMKLKIQELEEM